MRRIIPIQELNKPAFIKSTLLKVCLIAFLILLISIFFNKMVFSNLIFARGDTFLYFYPYWQAAADALRDGRIPLWNPNLFMGAPFLANSQAGFFYPLNWPLWYLLSVPQAIKVSVFIHLIIAAWGTYLAGRKILSLNKIAALFAAVLFALGGYLTAQVEHINQLQGLAWLPWFWVVTAFCGDDRPKMEVLVKGGVAFGLLFSLQIMAGHTQTAFITGISIIIWSLAQFSTKYLTTNISQSLRFSFYNQRFRSRFPTTILLGLGFSLFNGRSIIANIGTGSTI